jgi:hypothetical protein
MRRITASMRLRSLGMAWPVIERVTGVNEMQFQVLKQ